MKLQYVRLAALLFCLLVFVAEPLFAAEGRWRTTVPGERRQARWVR